MKKGNFKVIALLLALVMLVGCQTTPKETMVETMIETMAPEAEVLTGEGTAQGYGGEVKVTVTIEGKDITKVEVVSDDETPTIGGAAVVQLKEKIEQSNSTDIELVSGATITSEAVLKATDEAIKQTGIDPSTLDKKEVEGEALELNQKADIVIVGAGGAGLTAGIKASEAGKSVIIVEKAGNTGGNTNRATGGMNAAETKYQKEAGIKDTVEQFVEDTMKGGHDLNNPELVKKMAESSSDAIDWLDSIGAPLSNVGLAGGATNPRSHRPVDDDNKIIPVGTFLVEKLTKKAMDSGVKIIYNARVDEILMDGDKVDGVTAQTKEGKLTVNAKAVIVASGGFGGSDELVSKFRPELQGYVSTNAPEITGDAIAFLEKINADFVDMDAIQTHPTVAQKDGSLVSESLRGDGAILLNKEGQRFTDEMQTRDYVSNKINEQTDKTAWLVVDQKMFDESNVIQKYVKQGLLTEAKDFKVIAEFIGTDVNSVEETMKKWSSYVDNNKDEEFERSNLDKYPSNLSEGPYYIGAVAPGIHHTMGGVKIDTSAKVIDTKGNPINGLFAAGEVTGGVHGGNRLGGNAVTDIIVFGGVAGESAVEYLNNNIE